MSTAPIETDLSVYDRVSKLDPLHLDDEISQLPEFNLHENIQAIIELTGRAVVNCELIEEPSPIEALAALRDIDFLASSALRHGYEPVGNISGLEAQLLKLGRSAQTVPRGTVYTYAVGNPSDERQRTFTGTEAERTFIQAVNLGSRAIELPVIKLGGADLQDTADLAERLHDCTAGVDTMVEAIVEVRRVITPEFFSYTMRPFFDPLMIGGKEFTGAGGAQMQMIGIDYILWGLDDGDESYQQYYFENRQYLSAQQSSALELFAENNNRSVVRWLHEQDAPTTKEARLGALELLKRVRRFRFPHRKVAEDNFKLRSDTAVGSGKYRPDILDALIDKTDAAIRLIEDVKQ